MKIDFTALNKNLSYQRMAIKILEEKGELDMIQSVELHDLIQQIEEVNNDVISKFGEVLDTVTMQSKTQKESFREFLA